MIPEFLLSTQLIISKFCCSKAKMAAEVEDMKRQYEEKLSELETRAKTAKGHSPANPEAGSSGNASSDKTLVIANEEQKAALEK